MEKEFLQRKGMQREGGGDEGRTLENEGDKKKIIIILTATGQENFYRHILEQVMS